MAIWLECVGIFLVLKRPISLLVAAIAAVVMLLGIWKVIDLVKPCRAPKALLLCTRRQRF